MKDRGALKPKEVHQLNKNEYDAKASELIREYCELLPFHAPKYEEKELIKVFSKSNKRLSMPIQIYKDPDGRALKRYKFNQCNLVVEEEPDNDLVEVGMSKNMESFRLVLMRFFMSQDKHLKNMMEKYVDNIRELYKISRLWERFVHEEDTGTFGRWASQKEGMKKIKNGEVTDWR